MKSLCAAAALIAAMAVATPPAHASPQSEVCTFIDTLSAKGVPDAMGFLKAIAPRWTDESRAKIDSRIGAVMAKFSYKGGQAYELANLAGTLRDYLLVLNLSTYPGSVYARVLYEGDGAEFSLASIDFKSDYPAAVGLWPALQAPVAVDCGAAS